MRLFFNIFKTDFLIRRYLW